MYSTAGFLLTFAVIRTGDVLELFQKDETGWWFGELNGQRGHFPSNYVEELPLLTATKSSEA